MVDKPCTCEGHLMFMGLERMDGKVFKVFKCWSCDKTTAELLPTEKAEGFHD